VASGAFHNAFANAWGEVTGRAWPRPAPPAGFDMFEAGYIAAFLHGRDQARPVTSPQAFANALWNAPEATASRSSGAGCAKPIAARRQIVSRARARAVESAVAGREGAATDISSA
ncbi:MAG: hypothetical protein AAFW98_15715, partial [Pseudomonadota bacterium]